MFEKHIFTCFKRYEEKLTHFKDIATGITYFVADDTDTELLRIENDLAYIDKTTIVGQLVEEADGYYTFTFADKKIVIHTGKKSKVKAEMHIFKELSNMGIL